MDGHMRSTTWTIIRQLAPKTISLVRPWRRLGDQPYFNRLRSLHNCFENTNKKLNNSRTRLLKIKIDSIVDDSI